jgi:hypothetical protein
MQTSFFLCGFDWLNLRIVEVLHQGLDSWISCFSGVYVKGSRGRRKDNIELWIGSGVFTARDKLLEGKKKVDSKKCGLSEDEDRFLWTSLACYTTQTMQ